ncbi:MAG: DUF4397 domain-containing protein [Chitinophagaceae bacterium]|nr:DUF4397 domain-containing protein [Chitinophagaceae bacterium]
MSLSLRNVEKAFYSLLAIGFLFTSCLKKSELAPEEVKTYVTILHLAPSAPSAEVYINNIRETNSMPPGGYFSYYAPTNPGLLDIRFKKAQSDSLIAAAPIEYYDSLRFATIILHDNPLSPGNAQITRINDDFSGIDANKASCRFLNMSPDSVDVDFYIENDKVTSGRKNADVQNEDFYGLFQKYEPGSYKIKAKVAGSDSLIADISAQLNPANAYTIYLHGVSKGTGFNALKLIVLRAAF